MLVPNGIFPRNLNKETVPSRERARVAESRFDAGLRSHRGPKLESRNFGKGVLIVQATMNIIAISRVNQTLSGYFHGRDFSTHGSWMPSSECLNAFAERILFLVHECVRPHKRVVQAGRLLT